MKMKGVIFILCLFNILTASCGQSTSKQPVNENTTDTLHIVKKSDTPSLPEMTKDTIVVISAEQHQLEPTVATWSLTQIEIARYFSTAKQIENVEAAKRIRENYYPCSMVGELFRDGMKFDFIINASGIGILRTSDGVSQFFANDDVDKELFGNLNVWHSKGVKMLLLSQHNTCKYDECGDELGNWCMKWKLSVTDFNNYVSLCHKFSSSESLYQTFLNYPCWLSGYLVWDEEICSYILESSAPLWIRSLITHEYVGLFGCLNKEKGEKYVFEVAIDSRED